MTTRTNKIMRMIAVLAMLITTAFTQMNCGGGGGGGATATTTTPATLRVTATMSATECTLPAPNGTSTAPTCTVTITDISASRYVGEDLQCRAKWDDGGYSGWRSCNTGAVIASESHSYTDPGNYSVKIEVRISNTSTELEGKVLGTFTVHHASVMIGKLSANSVNGDIYALAYNQEGTWKLRTYDRNGNIQYTDTLIGTNVSGELTDIVYCGGEIYASSHNGIYKITGTVLGTWMPSADVDGLGCDSNTLLTASASAHEVREINLTTGIHKVYPTGNDISPKDIEGDPRGWLYTYNGEKMNGIDRRWESGKIYDPVASGFKRPGVSFVTFPINVDNRRFSITIGESSEGSVDEVHYPNEWGTQKIDLGTQRALGAAYTPLTSSIVLVDGGADRLMSFRVVYDPTSRKVYKQ